MSPEEVLAGIIGGHLGALQERDDAQQSLIDRLADQLGRLVEIIAALDGRLDTLEGQGQ